MKNFCFILLQRILPQHLLSRLVGKIADWQAPQGLLQWGLRKFVKHFAIDMSIALHPELTHYTSFNQFFIRQLKPEARPIAAGVTSPADGTVSQIGSIAQNKILQAKGIDYTLEKLLANEPEWVRQFTNGQFATVYLSPSDYHRVHMPYTGTLIKSIYIPGKLFSVNPTTVNNVNDVFADNERLVCLFNTDRGVMAVIFVGAMLVAGIQTAWLGKVAPNRSRKVVQWDHQQDEIQFKTGDELGFFNFGSTIITLFPENTVNWASTLTAGSKVLMGQQLSD